MTVEVISLVVSVALAFLGMIWHQQRTAEKLRDDMQGGFAEARAGREKLRDDMQGGFAEARAEREKLRDDMQGGFAEARAEREKGFAEARAEREKGFAEARAEREKLRDMVVENGRRIIRIEGWLQINRSADFNDPPVEGVG